MTFLACIADRLQFSILSSVQDRGAANWSNSWQVHGCAWELIDCRWFFPQASRHCLNVDKVHVQQGLHLGNMYIPQWRPQAKVLHMSQQGSNLGEICLNEDHKLKESPHVETGFQLALLEDIIVQVFWVLTCLVN